MNRPEIMQTASDNIDKLGVEDLVRAVQMLDKVKGFEQLKDEFMNSAPLLKEAPPAVQNMILSAFCCGAVVWRKVTGDIASLAEFIGDDAAAGIIAGESNALDRVCAAGKAEHDEIRARDQQ